jgi:hypothetical protein
MLRLQCLVYELLAMHLGNPREISWGYHKGFSRDRVERLGIARQCVPLLLCHRGDLIDRPQHKTNFPRICRVSRQSDGTDTIADHWSPPVSRPKGGLPVDLKADADFDKSRRLPNHETFLRFEFDMSTK